MSKPGYTGPTGGPNGEVIPSYVLKRGAKQSYTANGTMVRGVVVATYVDDEADDVDADPLGVYCDVLAYTGLYGNQSFLIRKAIVRQERSGLHDGDIWKPRAARIDMATGSTNINNAKPADLDGDHVIVGFLDQDLTLPVILGAIRHPRADKGKSDSTPVGKRLRLIDGDGDPRLWRHHGGFFGFQSNGDFIVDLTATSQDDYNPDGSQSATAPASAGSIRLKVREGGSFVLDGPEGTQTHISIDSNGILELNGEGGDTNLVFLPTGEITIFNSNEGSFNIKPNGDVEITAVNGAGDVKLNGTTVAIGTGAVQPAVLGAIWRANEAIKHGADITFWTAFSAYLTVLATQLSSPAAPAGPGAASFSALQSAMTAPGAALVTALGLPTGPIQSTAAYEAAASTQLSINTTVL